jgi:hypothetical protein
MDTFIGGYDLLTFNQEDINQIFNEQWDQSSNRVSQQRKVQEWMDLLLNSIISLK